MKGVLSKGAGFIASRAQSSNRSLDNDRVSALTCR